MLLIVILRVINVTTILRITYIHIRIFVYFVTLLRILTHPSTDNCVFVIIFSKHFLINYITTLHVNRVTRHFPRAFSSSCFRLVRFSLQFVRVITERIF